MMKPLTQPAYEQKYKYSRAKKSLYSANAKKTILPVPDATKSLCLPFCMCGCKDSKNPGGNYLDDTRYKMGVGPLFRKRRVVSLYNTTYVPVKNQYKDYTTLTSFLPF